MRTALGTLVVVIISLAALAAQARGRDDVMSGAYRCGAIGDDRQWLDCFYGAAQPLRAQLGLPAAPDAQQRLAAAPPAGGAIRNPMIRDGAMAGAARCYAIADDHAWLSCYYGASQPVRELLSLTPIQSIAPTPPVETPSFAVQKAAPVLGDGFSEWLKGSKDERIVSRLQTYSFDRYKIFTVKLANGQVWRQESGDTSYAMWKNPAAGYTVILTRGALGSVDLRVQGEPHIFKVTRIE